MLVLFLAASAAPTPLYRVYQVRWGFSATTLTAVFAVYVLFLLVTVLIFGSLSDHVGRRPMIVTALAVDTAACILFLLAHGVGALFAGRALQGVAVGLAASVLGAALLDLRPAGSPDGRRPCPRPPRCPPARGDRWLDLGRRVSTRATGETLGMASPCPAPDRFIPPP